MSIHPPTVFAIVCLLALFLGSLQIWLWSRDREQRALATVGVCYLLGAVGTILLAARGEIPDRISIDIANAMVAIGYGLLWTAMRQFERRRARPAVALLGAGIWLVACQIPWFYAHFAARIVLMSVLTGGYCIAAANELWRGRIARALPSSGPLAALLALNAVLHLIRAPLLVVLPMDEQALRQLTGTDWFGVVSLMSVVVVVGIAMLLVALAKEQAQQRSSLALTAARDAADKASAEKSRFLARMSHELRTLLNAVLGMAQILARDPGLDPVRREHAATLERAGRHLVAIVNDALDLARVEAGRLELSPRPVALQELLEEAVTLVGPAAGVKHIVVTLDEPAALPRALLLDPVRVRQILLNLLGNAVKFTPERGVVTLSAATGQGMLVLTVTDTGPGVPEDQRERLFHDYERMGADQAGMEGTGLGLAITAALAGAMGGEARYEPGPGGSGSSFIVTMPAIPTTLQEPAAPPSVPVETAARPLHILAVDDIAANRMVAEAMLTQAGHRVQSCADGAAAIEAIAAGPVPDIVLMDIFMPGMDGITATRRIRALPGPAGRVPILALTAEAAADEVRACLSAGMDAHVAKPIDRAGLLATIATVLRERGSMPATTDARQRLRRAHFPVPQRHSADA